MNKAYAKINWENYPSDKTPLNESNLNKVDAAVDEIDNRVITLETTKATKVEVAPLIQDITFDESTGIFTITKKNGSVLRIDTKMEKIAINFDYDVNTQKIILTLIDGTRQYIDLSALITQYEFLNTTTIGFEITSDGKVKANVIDGSITEDKLRPDYLADIRVEVARAQSSASAAATSASNALVSETNANNSKISAANSASNALVSETNANNSKIAAANSESNALNSAKKAESYAVGGTGSRNGEDTDNAKYYSEKAKASADNSATKASAAASSASAAANSASNASTSETNAKNSEISAANSASLANNYANGATESAKYYYEQAKSISESFSGALRPIGTVTFSNLPNILSAADGDMYNISDQFTTTSDFKEGAGNVIPAGSNIFKTVDGKWDILAGTPVTGVKGNAESSYRRGNVNITPANIGLGNVNNTADIDKSVKYATSAGSATSATTASKLGSATIGSETKPIYLNAGTPTVCGSSLAVSITGSSASCTGNASTSTVAAKIGSAGNTGTPMIFNWSGKDGQPTWLWGGDSRDNMYVYNPSNFSVKYATNSGSATNATTATKLATGRTINVNLASNTASSFDGSANMTTGCYGTLPISKGGTGATTAANALNNLGGLPKSGGNMTGSLNLANATWNNCGDDVAFGDRNIAGCMAFKGISTGGQNTGIALLGAQNESQWGRLLVANDGSDMYLCTNKAFYISNGANTARATIYASAFTQSSSRRVKTNIEDMTEEEAKKILELNPVSYDYINEDMPDGCFGLIAEDTYEIIPSCVVGDVATVCDDDDADMINSIGIDYSKLVPYLIKMVQIQEKRIDNLENILNFEYSE